MKLSDAFSKIKDIADAIGIINNGLNDGSKTLSITCSFSGLAPMFYINYKPQQTITSGIYQHTLQSYGLSLNLEQLRELKTMLDAVDL